MLLARRPEETTAIVLVITSAVNDASVICGLLSLAAFLPVALKYRACRFQKYCFFAIQPSAVCKCNACLVGKFSFAVVIISLIGSLGVYLFRQTLMVSCMVTQKITLNFKKL